MTASVTKVERVTWTGSRSDRGPDLLVREEPLEIRVNGAPIAVLMRTPGADLELVRGFLRSEGIAEPEQLFSLRVCGDAETPEGESNVVLATLQPEVDFDLARFRRNLFASSSCGLCGKATIEAALKTAAPIADVGPSIARARLSEFVPAMRANQAIFDQTGGLHAAAAFRAGGQLLAAHEDIGRHNAVDKVIGDLASGPTAADVMVVSGRISYEVTQKTLAARIPTLVGVSAPSALAVELARASNMTVVGFARDRRFVVYSDPCGRIEED